MTFDCRNERSEATIAPADTWRHFFQGVGSTLSGRSAGPYNVAVGSCWTLAVTTEISALVESPPPRPRRRRLSLVAPDKATELPSIVTGAVTMEAPPTIPCAGCERYHRFHQQGDWISLLPSSSPSWYRAHLVLNFAHVASLPQSRRQFLLASNNCCANNKSGPLATHSNTGTTVAVIFAFCPVMFQGQQ